MIDKLVGLGQEGLPSPSPPKKAALIFGELRSSPPPFGGWEETGWKQETGVPSQQGSRSLASSGAAPRRSELWALDGRKA